MKLHFYIKGKIWNFRKNLLGKKNLALNYMKNIIKLASQYLKNKATNCYISECKTVKNLFFKHSFEIIGKGLGAQML